MNVEQMTLEEIEVLMQKAKERKIELNKPRPVAVIQDEVKTIDAQIKNLTDTSKDIIMLNGLKGQKLKLGKELKKAQKVYAGD